MKTTSQCAILLISMVLGLACGGDDEGTVPGPVGGTPLAGTAAPGTAGTASSQAGTGAPTGTAGTVATTAGRTGGGSGGTGAAGTGAAGATAVAGTGAAGTGAAGAAGTAVAGSGGPVAGTGAPADPVSTAGKLPRVTTTDGMGPFNGVTKVMNTPPGGWLIYPKEIGKDGIKHPIFIFGPGGGTTPSTYETSGMHWDRYGSYGFVIYVLPMSSGDGAPMKAGLDWVIEQNDVMTSPLYQKLDTTKICAAGHSMGSVTTFDFMPDERVTTTIHISGGSFDGMGPSNLTKNTMFLCGEMNDTAKPQCDVDFMNSKVPTYYTVVKGSSHTTSGRLGWEAIIAWMLWHLADQEDQWKKEFVEPTGKFHMGIYQSQVKGW